MTERLTRPYPPENVLQLNAWGQTVPAQDVAQWVSETILDPLGFLFSPDHQHLGEAYVGFLWTTAENTSKGRQVIGQAEVPMFRCGKWQKARQEQQIREWFGDIPDFIITLDAYYCAQATDTEFLALVEHELYHCAQATDEFGAPKFHKETGRPSFTLRGHDVEEFIGVVRRYGVVSEAVKDLVIAAAQQPEVARVNIARACGTCALKSA